MRECTAVYLLPPFELKRLLIGLLRILSLASSLRGVVYVGVSYLVDVGAASPIGLLALGLSRVLHRRPVLCLTVD